MTSPGPIKCCRCKHVHREQDRIDVPIKGERGSFNQVCPRCSAHSFYMLKADGKIARTSEEWGQ